MENVGVCARQDLKSFDLQLENVSFVYPGSEKKVLNNINLHIKEEAKGTDICRCQIYADSLQKFLPK